MTSDTTLRTDPFLTVSATPLNASNMLPTAAAVLTGAAAHPVMANSVATASVSRANVSISLNPHVGSNFGVNGAQTSQHWQVGIVTC